MRAIPAGLRRAVCFAPDSTVLAALAFSYQTRSGHVWLWDAVSGTEKGKWTIAQFGPIVFSPDGRTLIGGSGEDVTPAGITERTFHLWDVVTGEDRPFTARQVARVHSLAISPDGRMLAWGDTEGRITLWDLSATQVRRSMKGHFSRINSLAFAPDGKTLASASADTTVLVWDVTGRPSSTPAGPLAIERLPVLWDDLASKDAGRAFDAIGLLSASAEQAVRLLKSKLKPAPAPTEPKYIVRLIADLDSEQFDLRQKAADELRRLGERAEPGLRAALKDQPPLETRKRIEELLEGVRAAAASPENLRIRRAVEVLEHSGTPDARDVLRSLANGAPNARLTRDAKSSLEQLAKRQASKP